MVEEKEKKERKKNTRMNSLMQQAHGNMYNTQIGIVKQMEFKDEK